MILDVLVAGFVPDMTLVPLLYPRISLLTAYVGFSTGRSRGLHLASFDCRCRFQTGVLLFGHTVRLVCFHFWVSLFVLVSVVISTPPRSSSFSLSSAAVATTIPLL